MGTLIFGLTESLRSEAGLHSIVKAKQMLS